MKENISEITRELRKRQTKSEKAFWELVRNRNLGEKFVRQFAISFEYEDKNRFFIADFYCHDKKLVVEIDGKIHEKQKDYDKLRTQIINQLGITVIRFTNEEIENIDLVKEKLMKLIT
ncbi:MAG TPA: endonuclease domain-containing protein [Clostridia bacterium]